MGTVSLLIEKRISRRNLLGKLGQLLATASGISLSRDVAFAGKDKLLSDSGQQTSAKALSQTYKIGPWTGDDFTLGHQLRKKQLPKFPDTADTKVDFVIVGGGMAGLTSAHYLEHEDYLLLEQYDDLGGQSRGDTFNGLEFSYGSTIIFHPEGPLAELLSRLELKPMQLDASGISWLWDSHWIKGINGSDTLRRDFQRFSKEAKPIWQQSFNGNIFAPLPDNQLISLDKRPFSNCLTGYSSQFIDLLNSYLRTYLGAGMASVSGLSGYAILNGLVEPGFVLPGGNATIVKTLCRKLLKHGPERVRTKSFVWSIEVQDDGCLVVYSGKDGVCHKVKCRHVIVTTPHLVSARIFNNLSDAARLPLFGYRYCSYLVATLLLKKSIFPDGFAHFVPQPFSFSEMAAVETPYKFKGRYSPNMGAALTVLQPYEPGTNGRGLLLAGDRESFSYEIVKQIKQLNEHLEQNLERIVLTRWGHALAVPEPNYFSKLNRIQEKTSSSYSLAHSSAKGLPRLESAVAAAHQAVNRALKIKRAVTLHSLPS